MYVAYIVFSIIMCAASVTTGLPKVAVRTGNQSRLQEQYFAWVEPSRGSTIVVSSSFQLDVMF